MSSARDSGIFYGWYNVAMAFTANFMATGTAFYIFNAFMQPLQDEHGWTSTQINIALVIGPFVGLFGQLFYGTVIYKIGPRIMMTLGPIPAGLSFIALGRVNHLWSFYLFYVLLCLGNGAMSGLVSGTAVNNWFVQKRGKAMGFAGSGISLSGVFIPFIALLILERTDLAHTYQWIGIAILFISPIAWLVVRDWPEQYGLLPDGAPAMPADQEAPETERQTGLDEIDNRVWTLPMLLRTPSFWMLGLIFAMILTGVGGVMSNLEPRFRQLGFEGRSAMYMMAATALMGAGGKFFWGMLCDRFDPRRVIAVLVAMGGLGLGLNLLENSFPALILFVVIYGFAMGGVMSTYPVIVAHLFGRRSFAAVFKFLAVFIVLQGVGPYSMGYSSDHTGSYTKAYYLFIALNIAAAILILTVKKPRMPDLKE